MPPDTAPPSESDPVTVTAAGRSGVRCPNPEPHEPHQYAIRADGTTYAGGLCDPAQWPSGVTIGVMRDEPFPRLTMYGERLTRALLNTAEEGGRWLAQRFGLTPPTGTTDQNNHGYFLGGDPVCEHVKADDGTCVSCGAVWRCIPIVTDSTPATAALRRCPWCRQFPRIVTVSGRQVFAVHSRFVQDELVSCSGSGKAVEDA